MGELLFYDLSDPEKYFYEKKWEALRILNCPDFKSSGILIIYLTLQLQVIQSCDVVDQSITGDVTSRVE